MLDVATCFLNKSTLLIVNVQTQQLTLNLTALTKMKMTVMKINITD